MTDSSGGNSCVKRRKYLPVPLSFLLCDPVVADWAATFGPAASSASVGWWWPPNSTAETPTTSQPTQQTKASGIPETPEMLS